MYANCRYELPKIIEELKALDADIIALQEVDIACERSNNVDTGEPIMQVNLRSCRHTGQEQLWATADTTLCRCARGAEQASWGATCAIWR